VGPRINLPVLWERRISCPFEELNPRYFTVPVTLSKLLDIYKVFIRTSHIYVL